MLRAIRRLLTTSEHIAVILMTAVFIIVFSGVSFAKTPGNEWKLISEARTERTDRAEAEAYYASLCCILKESGGVPEKRKYTEYSKTVLTLAALGYDPSDVMGYDVLSFLEDYDSVTRQGLNGPVWALIALDSGSFRSTKRTAYIKFILQRELPEGGWNMEGSGKADPDVTAMALQALSKYRHYQKVEKAVERAVAVLSELQESDGGYSSFGTKNSESAAQVIIAMCELGIDMDDERFVKDGKSVRDNLMTYALGDGTFMHTAGSKKADALATEQGNTALAALWRAGEGLSTLYSVK